jgi:hypothetical protein
MSAQRLRDAAKVLREAAEGADLKGEPTESDLEALRSADFGAIFLAPPVALALADWLAVTAWGIGHGSLSEDSAYAVQAVDLADAILGEDQ